MVIATLVIPLTIQLGSPDTFRFPKELAVRAEAILLVALTAIAWILQGSLLDRSLIRDPLVSLTAVALIWAVLTTATSSFPSASLYSFLYIGSVAATFFITANLVRTRPLVSALLVLPPALINSVVGLLQQTRVWNPFATPYGIHEHLTITGLVGNPDDLAAYLCGPALAAVAVACLRTAWRIPAATAAALITLCIALTSATTAIVAVVIGTATIIFLRRVRGALLVMLLIALGCVATPSVRTYFRVAVQRARSGDWNAVLSNRLTAWDAALLMAKDHPVVGVGPGRFRWHYYAYKFVAEAHEPRLLSSATREVNFGEVHNDFLQLAAEGGFVASLLGASILIALGARGTARFPSASASDLRSEFARLLAPGLAVAFTLLMAGFFPLELAAPTSAFSYLAALCVGWRPLGAS